jgi:hypothetical protein
VNRILQVVERFISGLTIGETSFERRSVSNDASAKPIVQLCYIDVIPTNIHFQATRPIRSVAQTTSRKLA